MPILLKYHILSGVFRSDAIRNLSSSDMLATALKNNFLRLSKDNGNVTVDGANIIAGDIAAVNGVLHLIDKVLTPDPLLAGVMPDFMTRLDQMPDYSIFRGYIIEYKLAALIEASETYTVFAPHNDAISTYIRSKTPATMDEDTIRYHIILGQQLMKNDLHDGMHRETLLGFSFQLGFLLRNGEIFVNDAPINYTNAATDKGVIHGIGKVLEIQKNRCDTNDTSVTMSKCVDCVSIASACEANTTPLPGIRKHCVYSKYTMRKKLIFIGCQISCVKTVITKACCSGFYGQQCLTCPGKSGKPCFGNGICLDGINGTGTCQCEKGFVGTACESCAAGKYGSQCDQDCTCVNGKCSEGITGDGSCECNVGWRGVKCDTPITDNKCSNTCHTSANCLEKADGTPYCQCASGFQGNGTMCTAIDACATSNGGCSVYAECRRTTPGNRNCICKEGYAGDGIVCLEIDPCMENNGGCDPNAECTKTGPNKSACNCLQGYSGDGKKCSPINPCLTKNGGCSEYAICNHTGPAARTCACKTDYIGDGIICKGNIFEELRKNTNTSNFYSLLRVNYINELSTSGPFTVFVPTNDALKNEQRTSEWTSAGMMEQIILYHIVACAQLTKEDLSKMTSLTSLQGEAVTVTSSQNTLVLNGDAKFASEDMILLTNGIVHLIDKVLVPKKMQQRSSKTQDSLKTVAESNGYNTFFKLLQDTEIIKLIEDQVHQPVTLFLPTDDALKNLPQEQTDFLYNKENKEQLTQYLKYHIVRDSRVSTNNLLNKGSIKTLQGSDLSVKCGDKDSTTGDIFLDNRQCKIIQRQLYFDGGIAYGINCLLTPLSLGGRCDSLITMEMSGECGMCFNVPKCPSGSKPKGEKTRCQYELSSRHSIQGCRQECYMVLSMAKCCKGYYGRDCQACPGGPETPCNKHGTCDEGYTGSGECRCSPEFNGTACELCMPGRYGTYCKSCDCTENGQCDEGITGTGECVCNNGWTGKRCETKLDLPPVCTPPCSKDAVCKKENTCECKNFYEGDGRTCKVVNLCKTNNGGCDTNAKCSQSGVKVTCSCLKGYSGDGTVCTPINRCADGLNGGCHEHAICTMTGPDKRKCECKDQYIGDGENCELKQLPIDRCMQDNGQCHTDALCADLHFLDSKVGVFHLRSPKGQYKYNFSEAKQACKDNDATVATYNQLSYAQQANYHMCAAGWLDGARVAYPTAFRNPNCGFGHVGIVDYGVRANMSETWDVFCYRYKDVQCTCKPGYVGDGYTCNGNLLQMLMTFPEFSNFLLEIFKYSNSSAKGKEFVSYISDLSIQATLFVPTNDSFNENVTLSGRDIEYHLSNVSTLYFGELSNGTSLQTRLGDTLLILYGDPTANSQDQTRFVGGKRIIQWDYIASNGIIHLISEPLKAPPQRLVLHAGHGAGIFFGIVVVIGLLAAAVYIYKNYSRKDFQFQQFHEDEDKPSVSVAEFDTSPSSNIANPMYESAATATIPAESTGETAYHPFSDADEQQLVTFGGLNK